MDDDSLECVSPDMSPKKLRRLRAELRGRVEVYRRLAGQHALLASDSRLKILSLLKCAGELCVCDLATVLEMTPAAVSQHLSRLRSGGMVSSRRDGMTVYYSLAHGPWSPVAPPPSLRELADDLREA